MLPLAAVKFCVFLLCCPPKLNPNLIDIYVCHAYRGCWLGWQIYWVAGNLFTTWTLIAALSQPRICHKSMLITPGDHWRPPFIFLACCWGWRNSFPETQIQRHLSRLSDFHVVLLLDGSHQPKWTSTVKQFTRHARCKGLEHDTATTTTSTTGHKACNMPCHSKRRLSNMQIALEHGRGSMGVAAANNESKCQNILLIIRRKLRRRLSAQCVDYYLHDNKKFYNEIIIKLI